MAVDHDVLVEHLTRLQLTCIRDQLDSLVDEAGEKQLTLRETVAFLVGREVSRKNERRLEMAMKIAHFPTVRELADFDFKAQPSVDKRQNQDLAAARWVAHGDAVLLLGPPGVGKSHLACVFRASCSSCRRLLPSANSSRRPSCACRFQLLIWFGCISCLAAIAWIVRSPRSASITTLALNSAVNRRLFVAISLALLVAWDAL